MKYSVDRFENNLAILEDINTKEKKEVPLAELPTPLKEGSILTFKDSEYIIDSEEETKRRERIMDKFKRLKK